MPPTRKLPKKPDASKHPGATVSVPKARVQKKSLVATKRNAQKISHRIANGPASRVQKKSGTPAKRTVAQTSTPTSDIGSKGDPIELDSEDESTSASGTQDDPMDATYSDNASSDNASSLGSVTPPPALDGISGVQLGPQSIFHRLPAELRNDIYSRLNPLLSKTNRPNRINLRDAKPDLSPYVSRKSPIEPEHAGLHLAKAFPFLADEIYSTYLVTQYMDVAVFSELLLSDIPLAAYRTQPRAGLYGVGSLVVDDDHWIHRVNPAMACIRHIRLGITEAGGTSICMLTINVAEKKTKVEKGAKPKVLAKDKGILVATVSFGASRIGHSADLKLMKKIAQAKIKEYAAREKFEGFKWAEIRDIASSFESYDSAKEQAKQWAPEKDSVAKKWRS